MNDWIDDLKEMLGFNKKYLTISDIQSLMRKHNYKKGFDYQIIPKETNGEDWTVKYADIDQVSNDNKACYISTNGIHGLEYYDFYDYDEGDREDSETFEVKSHAYNKFNHKELNYIIQEFDEIHCKKNGILILIQGEDGEEELIIGVIIAEYGKDLY
jgi:hypothetical protein